MGKKIIHRNGTAVLTWSAFLFLKFPIIHCAISDCPAYALQLAIYPFADNHDAANFCKLPLSASL